jgi:4-amino-4-deoxychorismate lyase
MTGHSWINGEEATTIPVDDRGLNYADGAFETFLCRDGRIMCRPLHEERLSKALSALQFDEPQTEAQRAVQEAERCLLKVSHVGTARLTVTRGSGPRGYAPPSSPSPRYILTASAPIEPAIAPWRCGIAKAHWQDQPQLAGLKLLARTEQVLAAREAALAGWDDAVMLDDQAQVISSSRGNIWMLTGQRALTPSLRRAGIAGTRRQLLIESVLPDLGYEVEECAVTLDEVLGADLVMITNTLVGIATVGSIEHRTYAANDGVVDVIRNALEQHIR